MDDGVDTIFLNTKPKKISVPIVEGKSVGILDVLPDSIVEPPDFTEEATVEAMNNLGIHSEDLVPKHVDGNDEITQIQVAIELEKKRLQYFENIIAERDKIIETSEDTKSVAKSKRTKKKKKKTKKLPKLTDNLSGVSRIPAPTSQRRKNRDSIVIEERQQRAVMAKKKYEEEQIAIALKALQRVENIKQKQDEMKREQQELIKQKAQQRLQKIHEKEITIERKLIQRKEQIKSEMQYQQKMIQKLHEKERKKYEQEMKWRQEKIYGTKKETNRFAELRKKILFSKIGSPGSSTESSPVKETTMSPSPILTIDEMMKKGPKPPRPFPSCPVYTESPTKKSKIPCLRPKKNQ